MSEAHKKEGSKDRPNRNHLIENFVTNSSTITIVNQSYTTTNLSFQLVNTGFCNTSLYKCSRVTDAAFVVSTGNLVPTGGMEVQLYDLTNAAIVTTITFVAGEILTFREGDILSYMQGLTSRTKLAFGVLCRRVAGGGSASIVYAGIEIHGKLPSVTPDT